MQSPQTEHRDEHWFNAFDQRLREGGVPHWQRQALLRELDDHLDDAATDRLRDCDVSAAVILGTPDCVARAAIEASSHCRRPGHGLCACLLGMVALVLLIITVPPACIAWMRPSVACPTMWLGAHVGTVIITAIVCARMRRHSCHPRICIAAALLIPALTWFLSISIQMESGAITQCVVGRLTLLDVPRAAMAPITSGWLCMMTGVLFGLREWCLSCFRHHPRRRHACRRDGLVPWRGH